MGFEVVVENHQELQDVLRGMADVMEKRDGSITVEDVYLLTGNDATTYKNAQVGWKGLTQVDVRREDDESVVLVFPDPQSLKP